jgi:hypothetical protein
MSDVVNFTLKSIISWPISGKREEQECRNYARIVKEKDSFCYKILTDLTWL